MAQRDLNFYTFLKESFDYKVNKNINAPDYSYLGYHLPFNGEYGIFYYARKLFPHRYNSTFPNTDEGNIGMARKILSDIRNKLDPELDKYFNTTTTPEESDQFHKTLELKSEEYTKAKPISATPVAETSVKPSTKATHLPPPPPPSEKKELNPSALKLPDSLRSGLNKTGEWAKLGFQSTIGKRLTATAISAGLGGLVGSVASGGDPSATGIGAAVGGGTGAALSSSDNARQGASDALNRLLRQPSFQHRPPRRPPSSGIKKASKKRLWLLLGLFIFFFLGVAFTGGGGSINSTPVIGLDYTLPLRDPSVLPVDIKDKIKASWSNAKLENWDLIIQKSQAAGWNPSFILALWIEESGAQGAASYTDALGCAPGQPTTDINISLNCVFNNFSNFSNNQFPQFMAKYSGGPPSNPFANNPNFPKNIKNWYSQLVPSGPGAIKSIIPSTGPIPHAKLDQILYWAGIINNALEHGNPITSWNRMVQNITNGSYTATTRTAQVRDTSPNGIYWCTNIVIDSYNLSSISGLGPGHQAVRAMKSFWESTSGYRYIPYDGISSLNQLKPGFVVFRIVQNDYTLDHASIIQSITLDQRGDGSIKTLDSNSFKNWSSTIKNGRIVEPVGWPIAGFGGIQ